MTFDLEQIIYINRYGSEMKLYRVTTLVKRFVDNVKKSVKKAIREIGEVTVDEVNEGRKKWIRRAQHDIQVNTLVSRKLGVGEDAEGILHCYGRNKTWNCLMMQRNQFYFLEIITLPC